MSNKHQSYNFNPSSSTYSSPSKKSNCSYSRIDFESLFEDSITNSSLYQVSLSSIKKCHEIRSGKELDKEAIKIADSLQDTSKNWQVRLAAIRLVQSVIVTPHLNSVKEIVGFVQRVSKPLAVQLQDKRSALTREACQTILVLAHVFEDDFGQIAADTFVNDLALFKLMQVANGVMAEQAHTCLLGILAKTKSNKIIDTIFKQTNDQRKQTRANCAEYLLVILLRYPLLIQTTAQGNFMDKYRKDFQVYLTKAMQDSTSEVRRRARMVFMRFLQLEPQLGHELIFRDVDCSYQRALYDDYVKYGIDPGITKLFRSDDEDGLDDEFGEDESDLVTEENFSNNYPSQIHSLDHNERSGSQFVSTILNDYENIENDIDNVEEAEPSNLAGLADSALANSLVLVSSNGDEIQGQQIAKNGPSMFQKRQMGTQRKKSTHRPTAESNNTLPQKNEKQAMTSKSKPGAPSQANHNFGQAMFERNSSALEAPDEESKPMLQLQPAKSAKGFKNAQRYKSPQHLSSTYSSTLCLPAMHKHLSKEDQPKTSLLKTARQSMMDFNRNKLQQQEAPDEEMGSNFLSAQSPQISQRQLQQRESSKQKTLTVNRLGAAHGAQHQRNNLQGSPVQLKNNFVGSPTARLVQTANHTDRQHRRSIGSVNNSTRTEQPQVSSKNQLDKLKRTYNLVSTIGRRSPVFRGSPPQTSPPGVLARTGSGGTVSRTPNTNAQTTATKHVDASGSTTQTTKRVKFDARKYINQKKGKATAGSGSCEREEEAVVQKKQRLKVLPQISHPPSLPKDIYSSRDSEIKNNKSQSSLSLAAQQYMDPHAQSTGRRGKQQRNKALGAFGDVVSSNSMVQSSTQIISPNREPVAEASSQNDHPQNEMLTLDLDDNASLDNKQCQVVLEMPEKYESSCKKLNNQDASLLNATRDSRNNAWDQERAQQMDGSKAPPLGQSISIVEGDTGMPDSEVSSLKSPSKLDLADNPNDVDVTDDNFNENQLQKSLPDQILQAQDSTESYTRYQLAGKEAEQRRAPQLPPLRLPSEEENLDILYKDINKDIDVDAKRFLSQGEATDLTLIKVEDPKTARIEANPAQDCSKGFETERQHKDKSERTVSDSNLLSRAAKPLSKDQNSYKQLDNVDITSSKVDRIEQNNNAQVLLETTQSQLFLDQSLCSSKLGLMLDPQTPKENKMIGFETVQQQVKVFADVYGQLIEKVEEIDFGENNWIDELHATFDMIRQEAGPQLNTRFKFTDSLAEQLVVHGIAGTHFKLLDIIDQQKTMDNIYQCLSLAGLTLSSLSQLAARNGALQRIVESQIDKALRPLLSVLAFNNLDINPYQSTLVPYLPVFAQLYDLCTPAIEQQPNMFKLSLLSQAEQFSQQAIHGNDCLKQMSLVLRIFQEVEQQASADMGSELNGLLNRLCQTMVEIPMDDSTLTVERLLQKTSQKILQTSKPLIVNHMPQKSLEKISEINESQDMSYFSKTQSVLYETARTSRVTEERNIREDATAPPQSKPRTSLLQVEDANKSEANRASLAPVSFRLSNTMSKIDFDKDVSEAGEEGGDEGVAMELNQTIKSEPGTGKMEMASSQNKRNQGSEQNKNGRSSGNGEIFQAKQSEDTLQDKDEESMNDSSNLNSSRLLSYGAQPELPMDIHTGAMTSNLPMRKQESIGPFGHIGGDGSSSHGAGSHKVDNGAARSLVEQVISSGRDNLDTLNFELSHSIQSDQRTMEVTRMSDIRLLKLDSAVSKVLDQEPLHPNLSHVTNTISNNNESSSQELLDFSGQLSKHKPQTSSLNLHLPLLVGRGLPPNFSISPNSSSFQNISESVTDRSNNLITQGLLAQLSSLPTPKSLSIPSLLKYQSQVQSDSSAIDFYELISGMFSDLRQKLSEASPTIPSTPLSPGITDIECKKQFILEFQVLLRDILNSKGDIIYEEHLSTLFDEIAETVQFVEQNEGANRLFKQNAIEPLWYFNLQTNINNMNSKYKQEKLTKIYTCLNLKMLNKSHPFLREILKTLKSYLERLKPGDQSNKYLFQIINDNLVELTQENEIYVTTEIQREVIECVRTIQILESKS